MDILTPESWIDYELIDTGGFEKLERFGDYFLARPEPQAVWSKSLPLSEWEKKSHAWYRRTKGINQSKTDNVEKGEWIRKRSMPEQWSIRYQYKELKLTFRLGLTSFGHIGVFPEQAANWNFIYDQLLNASSVTSQTSRVLNLFAHTGGSSLVACSAGADVVHVDSVKPVISWAREIMTANGLENIRWVVEDAMSFVRREVKRGHTYHGIIMDPPAYGRGPEGEKWVLGDSIDELIRLSSQLLLKEGSFFVLSLYSMGYSALIAENLVKCHFGDQILLQSGELYFPDQFSRRLPLGTFLRFSTSP